MAKSIHIKRTHIDEIVAMIRAWPISEKLKWDAICEASKMYLDYIPTRQALAGKHEITLAYAVRKNEVKAKAESSFKTSAPKSMNDAIEKIFRLEQENIRLKAELTLMAETAQRFIHNASLKGFTKSELMKPLINKN